MQQQALRHQRGMWQTNVPHQASTCKYHNKPSSTAILKFDLQGILPTDGCASCKLPPCVAGLLLVHLGHGLLKLPAGKQLLRRLHHLCNKQQASAHQHDSDIDKGAAGSHRLSPLLFHKCKVQDAWAEVHNRKNRSLGVCVVSTASSSSWMIEQPAELCTNILLLLHMPLASKGWRSQDKPHKI